MKERIEHGDISAVYKNALKKNIINPDDTSLIFYDLTYLKERIEEAERAFPAGALNTSAIKANPLIEVLKLIKNWGIGLEAASLPEMYMAIKAGYDKKKIVFDSPAKTREEIKYAVSAGVLINADSLDELKTIDEAIQAYGVHAPVGLRVNPQSGLGKISITSVAGEYSKFGVPVKEFRSEIIEAYLKYNWLTGIHLHSGSQGCPQELMLKGIETVYNLAIEINETLKSKSKNRKIEIFDIGGGFPVSYRKEEKPLSISDYAGAIKEKFPLLFSDHFKLVTEFGRYYYANAAFAISRVDNIKKQKGVTTVISHLGADFLLRRAFNPEVWHHDISVMDNKGEFKYAAAQNKYVIGGPLCFAGDMIAKDIELPEIETGDYLIIHDVGAYTLSMWSRYNSRQIPKVIGYCNNWNDFFVLRDRETLEDILEFWS